MNNTQTSSTRPFSDRKAWVRTLLPPSLAADTFESFRQDADADLQACNAAEEWCRMLLRKPSHGPLVIYGSTGNKATSLACCCVNALALHVPDRRFHLDAVDAGTADNIAFVHGHQLPDVFKGSELDNNTHRLFGLNTCALCVIAALDTCPAGGWSSPLVGLVSARILQFGLPTIITMMSSPSGLLKKYGEAGEQILAALIHSGAVFVRVGGPKAEVPPPVQSAQPIDSLETSTTRASNQQPLISSNEELMTEDEIC